MHENKGELSEASAGDEKEDWTEGTLRRSGFAVAAGLIACTVCCSLPVLLVSAGGAAASGFAAQLLAPGNELWIGVGAFLFAFAFLSFRAKAKKKRASASRCQPAEGCGAEQKNDSAGCCG